MICTRCLDNLRVWIIQVWIIQEEQYSKSSLIYSLPIGVVVEVDYYRYWTIKK